MYYIFSSVWIYYDFALEVTEDILGEGDTDTTDKKPEPEILEEVNEGENIKDNVEEPSEVPEEKTEL